ncbi:hypothetical protein A2U01_0019644, partial [Trifolium medium]|nr:hypothetical protein [Trifolium medium]
EDGGGVIAHHGSTTFKSQLMGLLSWEFFGGPPLPPFALTCSYLRRSPSKSVGVQFIKRIVGFLLTLLFQTHEGWVLIGATSIHGGGFLFLHRRLTGFVVSIKFESVLVSLESDPGSDFWWVHPLLCWRSDSLVVPQEMNLTLFRLISSLL